MVRILVFCLGLFVIAGCTDLASKRAMVIKPPKAVDGAEYLGASACLECHEDMANDHNVHMKLASFELGAYKGGCEGCHGPGSLHVDEDGDTSKIIRFGNDGLSPDEIAGVCTTCHQGGEIMHWASSEHAFNDVTCTDCHTIHHNRNEKLLAKNSVALCTDCHAPEKAKMYYMSHHPIKEGKMTCVDCHEPHGSMTGASGMLKTEERVNDLCLNCHTRYQGPFVFEHSPVSESCLECHEPHGTVANNLLIQNEPFLCLQCHEGHFHAMRTAVENPPAKMVQNSRDAYHNDARVQVTSTGPHAWARGFLTKCTSCHNQIHGSDLPSQAGALRGTGLTR